MIAPKKSPSRTARQHPFTTPAHNCSPREPKTTSEEGTLAANGNADNPADVNGTLDAFSVSLLRQFVELLERLDSRRSSEPRSGQKLDQTTERPPGLHAGLKLGLLQDKLASGDPPAVVSLPIAGAQAVEIKKRPQSSHCQPKEVRERSSDETRRAER